MIHPYIPNKCPHCGNVLPDEKFSIKDALICFPVFFCLVIFLFSFVSGLADYSSCDDAFTTRGSYIFFSYPLGCRIGKWLNKPLKNDEEDKK